MPDRDPFDAPSQQQIDAENKANIAQTTTTEAAEHGPRGNVHSEADEAVDQDGPPPFPN